MSSPDQGANDPALTAAWALETHAYKTQSPADYQAAADALQKCSQRYPDNLLLNRSLGYLYLDKLHQPQLAFPHLRAVYQATPDAPGWGQIFARDAGELGRSDLQIWVLRDVTKRDPKDPWCRLDLAMALAQKGQFTKADLAFQDAIRVAPDEEWVNIAYARFLRSLGRNSEAEHVARKVLLKHPKSAPALALIGDISLENSDFTGALTSYNQAIAADPASYDAKAGLSQLQRSQAPQLSSTYFLFQGTDHFFQSGIFNTLAVPIADHLLLNATFNSGWFKNDATSFPNVTRYQEGLGLEYRLNRTLSFQGGATGFQANGHDFIGFNAGATWKPTQNFFLYTDYRLHDPINDSIATVSDALTQDTVDLSTGYQFTTDWSARLLLSRASYSDGNDRNFAHVESLYTIWRKFQLQIGGAEEVIDYRKATPDYSSPSGYQTFGPVLEAEPSIFSWLSMRVRYEATYTPDDSKWGTILSAGPAVHINDRIEGSAEYLYYDVPGFTNYSGNGFRASFSYRF